MGARPVRGALIDRVTQRWVIATGRPISFSGQAWLDGPIGAPEGIGDAWIGQHAARIGASILENHTGGLLADFHLCDGPGFEAARLRPEVRDFYETTARWQLDVWSRWSRWAESWGRLLDAMFARRLRQLTLPLDPLHTAYGMNSRVITFTGPEGEHLGTAWQRTLRATGATVFGGFYGVVSLPGAARPSVRVVFPLPTGASRCFCVPISRSEVACGSPRHAVASVRMAPTWWCVPPGATTDGRVESRCRSSSRCSSTRLVSCAAITDLASGGPRSCACTIDSSGSHNGLAPLQASASRRARSGQRAVRSAVPGPKVLRPGTGGPQGPTALGAYRFYERIQAF